MPRTLTLVLDFKWFAQAKAGVKKFEYRETKPYWIRRIAMRHYDKLVLRRGYSSEVLELPYRGYEVETITHEHFYNVPVEVFAIRLIE